MKRPHCDRRIARLIDASKIDPRTPFIVFAREVTIEFTISTKYAAALRSAVEEFSNQLGTAIEQPKPYATEQSLTDAIIAFGALRSAVNAAIPKTDPHFSL